MENVIKVKKDEKVNCWLGYWIDGCLGGEWLPLPFTLDAPFSMVLETLKANNPEYEIIQA